MITFHPSADGNFDYLDFHTQSGDRLYLPRHEMRALLEGLLAAVGEDVVCGHCGRSNGVHQVRRDGDQIQVCAGHRKGWLTASDPEPPPDTTVEMEDGQRWTRYAGMWPGSWLAEGHEEDGDPETWTKVAGNYGPVRIVEVHSG